MVVTKEEVTKGEEEVTRATPTRVSVAKGALAGVGERAVGATEGGEVGVVGGGADTDQLQEVPTFLLQYNVQDFCTMAFENS